MAENTAYWLWFARVAGTGAPNLWEMLGVYGDPRQIYEARYDEDMSPWLRPMHLERLRGVSLERCEADLEELERAGIRVLAYGQEFYPDAFLGLDDAPLVLYATGNPALVQQRPAASLVGSRRPSAYGSAAAAAIAEACAQRGILLVSGLADGLDSEAHKAAVQAGTPTAAFLGTAIDRTYPATNRRLRWQVEQVGAVFSEYGPGEGGYRAAFLDRNRLIAAMGDALCVAEARLKSGTMSTVGHALRYGKPVFAVPGNMFSPQSEGANTLIAEGKAQILPSPEVLVRFLTGEIADNGSAQRQEQQLNELQAQLLAQLKNGPQSLGQLCEQLRKDAGSLLAELTGLELMGFIRSAGGTYGLK